MEVLYSVVQSLANRDKTNLLPSLYRLTMLRPRSVRSYRTIFATLAINMYNTTKLWNPKLVYHMKLVIGRGVELVIDALKNTPGVEVRYDPREVQLKLLIPVIKIN